MKRPTLQDLSYQMALVWLNISNMDSFTEALEWIEDLEEQARVDYMQVADSVKNERPRHVTIADDIGDPIVYPGTFLRDIIDEMHWQLRNEWNRLHAYRELTGNDPEALRSYMSYRQNAGEGIGSFRTSRLQRETPMLWPYSHESLLCVLSELQGAALRYSNIETAAACFVVNGEISSRRTPPERIVWIESAPRLVAFLDEIDAKEMYLQYATTHFVKPGREEYDKETLKKTAYRARNQSSGPYMSFRKKLRELID